MGQDLSVAGPSALPSSGLTGHPAGARGSEARRLMVT